MNIHDGAYLSTRSELGCARTNEALIRLVCAFLYEIAQVSPTLMSIMTSHSVVDRLAADLAERRRNTIYRNSAYIALARAILSDESKEQAASLAYECQASIGPAPSAA
jgi:hypothetical protein